MESRDLRISFCKAGNGKSARLVIPIPWLRTLGITQEQREIVLTFDNEKQEIKLTKRK